MANYTFYPSNDGEINKNDATTGWANVHDAASGSECLDTAVDALTSDNTPGTRETAGSDSYDIFRAGFVFDSSSIVDAETVSTAVFSIYTTAKSDGDNDGNDYLAVVSFNPGNVADFDVADYNDFGATEWSNQQDITGITTSAYTDFTLNATGLAAVSKTGNTILGLREGHDILNDPCAVSTTTRVTTTFSATAGTTQDPKLVVTTTDFIPKVIII